MWSGAIVCVQPRRLPMPWTVITFEPIPSIGAPIATSMRARSWTCGSEAALRITVGPRVSAAAISAFSVAITDGSSIRKSHGPQAECGASDLDVVGSCSTVAPSARNASRCGSSRRRPITSPPGRRHQGVAEAREQRAGEQERRADPLGQAAVDLVPIDVGGVDRHLARAEPLDLRAEPLEQQRHRLDVADPRHVAQDHLVVGEQAGGEDRQRAVLVSGGHDRA